MVSLLRQALFSSISPLEEAALSSIPIISREIDRHKFLNSTVSSINLKLPQGKNQSRSPLSRTPGAETFISKTIESRNPTLTQKTNETAKRTVHAPKKLNQLPIQSNIDKTQDLSDVYNPDPNIPLFPVQRVDNNLDQNKLILQSVHVPSNVNFSMNKPILAIIAATRSMKGWQNASYTQLQRYLLPSLEENVTAKEIDEWDIRLYLAVDNDDTFWVGNNKTQWLTLQIPSYLTVHAYFFPRRIKGHIPFNEIAAVAYRDGAAYFCRINDDSSFKSTSWISQAVNTLKAYNPPNVGVVGPTCHEGNIRILTHDFVHRTHLEIFNGEYYPSVIHNWSLDDWITFVYSARTLGKNLQRSTKLKTWIVQHWASAPRYFPQRPSVQTIKDSYADGAKKILAYIEKHPEYVKSQSPRE